MNLSLQKKNRFNAIFHNQT